MSCGVGREDGFLTSDLFNRDGMEIPIEMSLVQMNIYIYIENVENENSYL